MKEVYSFNISRYSQNIYRYSLAEYRYSQAQNRYSQNIYRYSHTEYRYSLAEYRYSQAQNRYSQRGSRYSHAENSYSLRGNSDSLRVNRSADFFPVINRLFWGNISLEFMGNSLDGICHQIINLMTVGLYKPSCGLSFLTSLHSFYIVKQFEVYTNRQSFYELIIFSN